LKTVDLIKESRLGTLLEETRVLLRAWKPPEPSNEFSQRVLREDLLGRMTAYRARDIVRRVVFARRPHSLFVLHQALISCSRHAGTNIRARTNFHQTLRSIVTSKQAYKSFDKRKPGWINVKLEPATEASLAA